MIEEDYAVAVVFSYPMEGSVRIPVENVFNWYDSQNKLWQPTRIVWSDGSESYAKGWWDTNPQTLGARLVRVGAGAYGNNTILEREVLEKEYTKDVV